jgi:UDP-N-acetylglucosamine 4-epimerase
VIPKWTAALLKGEAVYINGDGETSRDFCFVANAVQANLLAACSAEEAKNQVYNVAIGERTSLSQLYVHLRDNLSSRFPHLEQAMPVYRDFRLGDVPHSLADISKAKNLLGYHPSYRINKGLEEAMDWYIEFCRESGIRRI